MNAQKNWPIALFALTLIGAATLAFTSIIYYQSVNRIEQNTQYINQLRSDYENRVRDLQSKLVVEKTESVDVPSTSIQRVCKTGPFGLNICIPEIKTVSKSIQHVTKAEDPKVRTDLDRALQNLEKLSSKNQESHASSENLKSIYDFTHDMMKPVLSVILLLASLYIILSRKFQADQEKWAFGSLGTIIGIWLKGVT